MKARLCLHGVDVKHQAQLLGLVKKELKEYKVTYKVKEKYFPDNDMYKCRVARFMPQNEEEWLRVYCAWGVLLVSDKLINVADIIIEYEAGTLAEERVQGIVRSILESKLHFVLDEHDLARRIDLLRGRYFLDKLPDYDEKTAMTALRCHIPGHLYVINKLWEQLLLAGGGQRQLWRQLRVKLRRLRSVLALVKPLFPKAADWQRTLKAQATALSGVREYDVLLQTCARLRSAQDREAKAAWVLQQQDAEPVAQSTMLPVAAVPNLQRLLEGLRQQAQVRALQQLKLNQLTYELTQLYMAVYSWAGAPCCLSLREFFVQRLGKWARKLQELPQLQPDVQDMEQLHRMRIRLKRFRYALQSVPELGAASQLLRSLKYLQDLLGVVHDDYVNEQYLVQLVAAYPELPELRYEVALLRGYEQAKADGALEQLSAQWQEFERLLGEWLEELE